ncbi:MAG: hypothetical protein ACYTEZ_14605 [Planctomycetota bacterium]
MNPIHKTSLRALRESLGLTAPELADRAECPVEVVLRAEFGMAVPVGEGLRVRLAAAYRLAPTEYLRLALDEAERCAARYAI